MLTAGNSGKAAPSSAGGGGREPLSRSLTRTITRRSLAATDSFSASHRLVDVGRSDDGSVDDLASERMLLAYRR